jgi:hypothetical protein
MHKTILKALREKFVGKKVKITYKDGGKFVDTKYVYNIIELEGTCIDINIEYEPYESSRYIIMIDTKKEETILYQDDRDIIELI